MKRFLLIPALVLSVCNVAAAIDPDTAFNNQFRREIGGWIAADATYSILLPDGRTLWLFGDTFIGKVDENNAILPGSRFIRNSAVLQEGDQLQTLFGGTRENPEDFIATLHPDSTWYWPEHGTVEHDTLRIFVAKYRTDPDGSAGFQFEYVGNDIASFTYPSLEYIHSEPVAGSMNGVIYGDRILRDTAYYFIYGRRTDDPGINIAYPHVARVPHGELMKQEWEYFTGDGWSTEAGATRRMNESPVSQQYSVSTYRGKYILLTQDIWLSPRIWSFTSSSPSGPWENRKLVYTTPESSEDVFTYNAYVHPQFDRDREMLVSYNVNGDFWSIFSNVELYRPRFIRVPYMNLDYAFWPNRISDRTRPDHVTASLYPNPVEAVTFLELTSAEPATLQLEILDMGGRTVMQLPDSYLETGKQTVTLQLGKLGAGAYICRIRMGGAVIHLPLIKTSRPL